MRKHLLNVAEMRHKAGAFLLDILSAEGDHPIGIPALVCITEPTANPHTGKAGVHNVGIVGGTMLFLHDRFYSLLLTITAPFSQLSPFLKKDRVPASWTAFMRTRSKRC